MPSDKPSMLIISLFSFISGTQICMQELQISLKCNNAKCSWSVNDKSMHNTSLKEEGSEGMMQMMYAEVKMGHLYPTMLKIQLQWVPLHRATWKWGSMRHFLPSFPRHRFLQGSTAPTAPGMSHRIRLQCNDSKWGEHQHTQLLAGCLLPPQKHTRLTPLTGKWKLVPPQQPGLLQENPGKLRAPWQAKGVL